MLWNIFKVLFAHFLSLPFPTWRVMHEWIFIIWRSCILSARLWEAAVSQTAAFSASGVFTQEQHGTFCRGLERVIPKWMSPGVARWCTGVTWLICTTQPRTCTAGPNSIYKSKIPLGEVKYMVTGIAMSPPAPDITASAVQPGEPLGSWQERLMQMLVVHSGTDRYRLSPEAMETVELEINIIMRDFDKCGVNSWTILKTDGVYMYYSHYF